MKITKNDILFTLAILFAFWFIGTGYIWVYWAALIMSYPFAGVSFLIWQHIKKDGRKRNQIIPIMLILGLAVSLIGLLLTR